MPHGTPDWGLIGPIPTFFGLDDMAEQAVRLGAVSSWDRIGHVVFSDNFREGTGAWRSEISSADGRVCLFTGQALSQPFCVRLLNGSGGARYARMRHYLAYLYRGRCGLECGFALSATNEYIKLGLYSSLPAERRFFYVRLAPTTGDLAHGDDLTGWTPFANIGVLAPNIYEWHNVKLVADFATGFFVKIVWDGVPIDMSAIAATTAAALARFHWSVYVEVDSTTAAQYLLHVDDVIVTVDEP